MATVTGETSKKIVLTHTVKVDGEVIRTMTMGIDSENPASIEKQPSYSAAGPTVEKLYKDNRVAVRASEAKFEDEVYALQDQMIAEKEAKVQK